MYFFPTHHLRPLSPQTRNPIVLNFCGTFSPITTGHLELLERTRAIAQNEGMTVMGAYISPVNDGYKKASLNVSAFHRVQMCLLAVQNKDWIMVDHWEASQPSYQRTIQLKHLKEEINSFYDYSTFNNISNPGVGVALVCGSDLFATMANPNIWHPSDVQHILSRHKIFVINRIGTKQGEIALQESELLRRNTDQIHIVPAPFQHVISSTLVRDLFKTGGNMGNLLAPSVARYIRLNHLYDQSPHKESKL